MKTQLDRFRLLEQIEPKGYTIVYRAEEDLGRGFMRPAAVKILQSLDLDDEAKLAVLRHEVEMLIEVGSCPNIITIFALGIDEEVGPWIAMELGGKSLMHFIGDDPAEPDQVRVMLRDALRALMVVHGTDPPILHRDLKPNNILSTDFGHWVLVDFGLARRWGEDETLHLATVQYAAPELLDTTLGTESPKMDLYSLGMAAYKFALGEELYRKQFPSVYDPYGSKADEGDLRPKWMYWHTSMQMTVPPVADVIEDYPKDLSDLIAALMAKPMEERPDSAAAAIARLGQVEATFAMPVEEVAATDDVPLPSRWRTPALAAVVVVLLVLVGAVLFNTWSTARPSVDIGDTYTGTSPIRVSGTIDRFPRRGSAMVALPDGSSYPVYVDDEGSFTSEVDVPELGSARGFLKVLNGAGQEVALKSLTLERVPPETVQIILATRPIVRGAEVVITSHHQPDVPFRLRTDEGGRARAKIGYGTFDLVVSHARYRRLTGTNRSTGIDPVKEMFANLAVIPLYEIYQEMRELIDRLEGLALKKANCPPGPLSEKEEERYTSSVTRLEEISQGDADLEMFLDAVRQVRECDPESAKGVKAAAAGARETVNELEDELPPEALPPGFERRTDRAPVSTEDTYAEIQSLIKRLERLAKRKANCPPGPLTEMEAEIFASSIERLLLLNDDDPDVALFIDAVGRVEDCNPESAADVTAAAASATSAMELKKEKARAQRAGRASGDDGVSEKRELIDRIERLATLKANCPPGPLSSRQREILATSIARLQEIAEGDVDTELFLDAVSRVQDCVPESAAGVKAAADSARPAAGSGGAGGLVDALTPPVPQWPGGAPSTGGAEPRRSAGDDAIGRIIDGAPEPDPAVVAWLESLSLEAFQAFVESNVPMGALTVTAVPDLNLVRVNGPIYDDDELERLVLRLLAGMSRLQLEVLVDPWAVCGHLTRRLENHGAENVRVHAYLAPGDHRIFVQFEEGTTLGVDRARTAAEAFVIDHEMLHVQTFVEG